MIYIVRHGQTDWNVEGRIAGRTNISINEEGRKEAKIVRDKLKDVNFDYVFVSPLNRTIETAKIITDKELILDDRLIERNNGALEGKLKREITVMPNYNDAKETMYGIEPLDALQKRVTNFFEEIFAKYPGKNILIVTHGGVSINIRSYFEGVPTDGDYSKYKLKNCEIITYEN